MANYEYIGDGIYRGLAADTKPTAPVQQAIAFEIDTRKTFYFQSGAWVEGTGGTGGATNLDGLTDVVLASPSNDQVLKYNGTNWINATSPGGGGAAAIPVPTIFLYKSGGNYVAQTASTGATISSNAVFATVFQAAINSISPAGTPTLIQFAAGDFVLDSSVTIPNTAVGNIHLRGCGIGLTRIAIGSGFNGVAANTIAIRIGNIPTPVAGNIGTLTVNCNARDTTCTMSTTDAAKFAVGDYVLLRSNALFSTAPNAGAKQGEIHQVINVNAGTGVVTFDTLAFNTYTTANTATLVKETFLQHIKISELEIVKGPGLTAGATAEVIFVACQMIDDLQLENVGLVDSVTDFYSGISLDSCINSTCRGIRMIQTPTNTYNEQYGLAIEAASQNISISDCHAFGRWRHPFEACNGRTTTGYEGNPRGVLVSNCTSSGSEYASFDTHPDGEYIHFSNCSVMGTQTTGRIGFEIRTRFSTVTGCSISGSVTRGIAVSGLAHDCQITSCSLHNCTQSAIRLVNDGGGVLRTTIMGCNAGDNRDEGIRLDSGCDYTSIVGNTCNNNGNTGIYIVDCDHVCITNNSSVNNANRGILLSAATRNMSNITVENNDVTGNTGSLPYVQISEAGGFQVRGNTIVRNNSAYNPVGNVTNPWPLAGGDLLNVTAPSSPSAVPTSNAVYTVRQSPKTIIISDGTVSQIDINGTKCGQIAGIFKLGIGETIKVTLTVNPTVAAVRAE
jgi:hypothetical protein